MTKPRVYQEKYGWWVAELPGYGDVMCTSWKSAHVRVGVYCARQILKEQRAAR